MHDNVKRVLVIAVLCMLIVTVGVVIWNATLIPGSSPITYGAISYRPANNTAFAGYNVPIDQGIATDGQYNYGFTTQYIVKYSLNWDEVINATGNKALADVRLNTTFGHIGDGDVSEGKIYAPCAEVRNTTTVRNVTSNPSTHNRIGIWNASDLSYVGYIDLSRYEDPVYGHGIDASCIAIKSENGSNEAYVGAFWNSTIWHFNMSDWSLIDTIKLGSSFTQMQGIDYYNGHLYLSLMSKGIVRTLPDGTNATIIVPLANIGPGELEGISVDSHGTISVLMTGLGKAHPGMVFLYANNAST